MQKNTFVGLLIGVALIIPTAQASAFSTTDFLSRLASLETMLQVLQIKAETISQPALAIETTDTEEILTIQLGDDVLHTSTESNEDRAMKVCEAIVFDPQYMWQEMTCQYGDATLYQDAFVAG